MIQQQLIRLTDEERQKALALCSDAWLRFYVATRPKMFTKECPSVEKWKARRAED